MKKNEIDDNQTLQIIDTIYAPPTLNNDYQYYNPIEFIISVSKFGKIKKTFETETSHIVRNAYSTRCKENIHGHSYKYEVTISDVINDDTGMVMDFGELGKLKSFIDLFDHATVFWSKEDPNIIDFFKCNFKRILIMKKNPTAENMARLIHKYVIDEYKCSYAEVNIWETRTGCGIACEHDNDDILIYNHENV